MSTRFGSDPNFAGASVADPAAWEQEIAFISGVASNATVAATSYGAWSAARAYELPELYHPTLSYATKWGSTTLLPFGAPGGNRSYWLDPAWDQPVQRDQWKSALALWSAEVNISFTEVMDPAAADFTLQRRTVPGSFQSFPNSQASTIGSSVEGAPGTGAFIRIGTDTAPLDGLFETQGGDAYFALVHELGHMLGLGHGGPYNSREVSDAQQFSVYDMQLWAIESYLKPSDHNARYFNDYSEQVQRTNWGLWGTDPDDTYWPTTPMMLDILAAQRIYGRPTSGPLVGGNHTFGFNSNLDDSIKRYFDFNTNTHPVITIWDGGVNNTLDLSGWDTTATIDLNPGAFTSANGQINNIAIAIDTVIETAKGGSGNDYIYGNSYANALFGNAGSDWLEGRRADDEVTGGPGSDYFVLASPEDAFDTFTDFTRPQGDQIALVHDGFGLNSTGSLASAGVKLVYGVTQTTTGPTILEHLGDVFWYPDGIGGARTALARVTGIGVIDPVGNPDTTGWSVVATGDFNADGITDVLWKNTATGDTSEWLMGNGTMAGNPATLGAAGWNVASTGDFNGDRTIDVLWKHESSGVTSEWLMSPSGGVLAYLDTPPAQGWDLATTADFNRDAIADLLWKNAATGMTSQWMMSSAGGVGSFPATPGALGWDLVSTGDFNGDRVADLMWKNASSGVTSEWLMAAGGGVASFPGTPPALGWDLLATADFNRDGIADLFWKNPSTGMTSQWMMSPGGGVGSFPSTPPATGWDFVTTGDFNGDGIMDLMWKNASSGATSQWLMADGGGMAANPWTPGAAGWNFAAAGDFNADGIADLLWRNASTEITNEWLMTPDGGVGASSFPTTPEAQGLDLVANGDFSGLRGTDLVWTNPTTGATTTWAFTHLLPGDFQIV